MTRSAFAVVFWATLGAASCAVAPPSAPSPTDPTPTHEPSTSPTCRPAPAATTAEAPAPAATSVTPTDGSDPSTGATGEEVELVARVEGRLEIVTVDESSALAAAGLLEAAGTVIAAGPVVPVAADGEADPGAPVGADAATDPLRSNQWALDAVPVEPLWTCGAGAGIDLAVIDTGVAADHPDLVGRVGPGVSTLDGATVPGAGGTDSHGHGTHVAGIAAAAADDGVGIAGAAPAATIMPVKVLHADGTGTSDDVARGIRWAVDNGAEVLNLSLSSSSPSVAMSEAIRYAVDHGATVLTAAGNGGTSGGPRYPAADDDTIAVGAVDADLQVASFSSRGSWVDVVAPGQSILSCIPGGWATKSGTSMASPYVAGIVAAILSSRGPATHAGVLAALTSTAFDRGPAGFDADYGYGVVDPVGAHDAL